MPDRITAYTNCIYPLKLHEYLASSRPVVGTPIRTLREFPEVVGLAEGVDGWSTAIAEALGPTATSRDAVDTRVAVARRHDWDQIAYRVARALAHGLGADVARRFEALPAPESWRSQALDGPRP